MTWLRAVFRSSADIEKLDRNIRDYEPRQALEKFLALAMAISNDFDRFERSTRHG